MNKVVFNDENLKKLGLFSNKSEVMYSDENRIKFRGKSATLMCRVRKGSKTLYLFFEGKRHQLGFWDEMEYCFEEAREDAMNIVKGIQKAGQTPQCFTFGALAEQSFQEKEDNGARAIYQYRKIFNQHLPQELKDKQIELITRDDAIALLANVRKQRTRFQANRTWEICNAVWNYAKWYIEGVMPKLEGRENPFARLKDKKVPRKKMYTPTLADLKYAWRAIDNTDIRPSIKAMMKLKMLTGMHMSEISNLQSGMFESNDLGDWIVMPVGHHKNSNYENMIEHKIWLHPKTMEMLRPFIRTNHPESYLFYGQGFDPTRRQIVNQNWRKVVKANDLDEKIQINRFRHCLVTYLRNKEDASLITGHCYVDGTASKHYSDWDNEEVLRDMMKANKFYQETIYQMVA